MTLKNYGSFKNAVRFLSLTSGTDDFVVGSAPTGWIVPERALVISGKIYNYYAQSQDGNIWEFGTGAYDTVSHKLHRTTIIATSNSDSSTKIYFDSLLPPYVDVFPSSTQNLETIPLLAGFLQGYTLSVAASGGLTFGVASGICIDGSGQSTFLTSPVSFTKTMSNWSEGTGGGSLDTGSIVAQQGYHVFAIQRIDGYVDFISSLSATTPLLPAGYILTRRIGWVFVDVTLHLFRMTQVLDEVEYYDDLQMFNNLAIVGTQVTNGVTSQLYVPDGVPIYAKGHFAISTDGVTAGNGVIINSSTKHNVAPFSNGQNADLWINFINDYGLINFNVYTTNARILWRPFRTGGFTSMVITGYTDTRGRTL